TGRVESTGAAPAPGNGPYRFDLAPVSADSPHKHARDGTYPPQLVITTAATTTTSSGPSANAGLDQSAKEGSSVSFSGTASGGAAPLGYRWDFGDGGSASGTLTPSHTYADHGSYTATLTVTDAAGLTA